MRKNYSDFIIDLRKIYYIVTGRENPNFLQKIRILIWNFELHCIAVYRFGKFSQKLYSKFPPFGIFLLLIYFFFDYQCRLLHHVVIHRHAEIGPGFHLGHASNIMIGPAKIGYNCNIAHSVTIGVGLGLQEFTVPEIGNNVWIGPGSVITGNCKIDDGSAISALTLVSKNIPPRSLVMGNPGRIIDTNYDVKPMIAFNFDKYINNDNQ